MAKRRMISADIIGTDAFCEMPHSCHALYLQLIANADDDGFVSNHKSVMKMISAPEDSYKILVAKKFILEFESGIIVIKHWLIHNLIRKDRYIPTNYQDELKQLEIKKNKSYTFLGCQNDNQMATNGCHRLGEYSIGKDSIDKNSEEVYIEESNTILESKKLQPQQVNEIISSWNKIEELINIQGFTRSRLNNLEFFLNKYGYSNILKMIENVSDSKFLRGLTNNDKPFKATFDWCISKEEIFIKILEGNFQEEFMDKSKPQDIKVDWLEDYYENLE